MDERHIIFGLIALFALSACEHTVATVADNSAQRAANAAYFADDFNCTKGASEQIDLKLLNAATARYMEKCIRLEAFTEGSALYVNAAGIKPIKASAVGLYWKDSDTPKHLKLGPSFVVITARMRDCTKHNEMTRQAALLANAPGTIPAEPAILGACKTAATALFISDAEVVPTAMD